MSAVWQRILNNPALVFALLGALVNLGAAYGLNVSPVQLAGVDAVISAFIGLITRANVTPTRLVAARVIPAAAAPVPPAPIQ